MANADQANTEVFEPSIAICTALPKELAACRLVLDSPQQANSDSVEDGNQYYRGSMPSRAGGKPHQVVLTSLAKMGNNVATGAVTQMTRSFPSIEHILMVGIAGGVPDPQNTRDHVRLGDVVVSNEKGVLQYDQIKKASNGDEIRDNSAKPGAALIAAAKALESDFDLGQFSLEPHLRRAEHLPHFRRPPPETDLLYASENQEKQIHHPVDPWREHNPTSPRIHLAGIGSANILLKDPNIRDKLGNKYGVRAIEMEGSGTADAAWGSGRQYLVIRGICDYCDTHKNDDWQYYAALVAAAYARALIENLAYRPPRTYNPGSSARQEIQPKIDRSVAARPGDALDIDRLRSELGDAFAEKLGNIIEKRTREGPDVAWEELSTQLTTMPADGVPAHIQAQFYYQAARWSQEDAKPASQADRYHKKALGLFPTVDDRTYRAFEAASKGRTDDAIEILRPFDPESAVVNLCRHLLEADRAPEAETLLNQVETPLTDEIRRMRALCRSAAGDPNSAWRILEPAMPERRENPLFLLTAGYIAYWQAIPPDFRMPQALSPSVFQTGLFSLNNAQARRMSEAFEFLKTAYSLLPADSKSPLKRDARDACIAAGMVLPAQHSESIGMAQAALRDDPTAAVPALCLLRMNMDHDWFSTIAALAAVCDLPQPQIWQLDLVIELLMKTGKLESAWEYLERSEHRYASDALMARWFELAIRCLGLLDRLPELESRVANLDGSTEHRRLKAAFWNASGATEKTLAIAEDLARKPGDRLDLINLVAVHGGLRMWLELTFSAACCLRRYSDAPGEVADALVHGFLELNEPEAALTALQAHELAYTREGRLDAYHSRLMSANGALGRYQEAFAASEYLWQCHPNERLLEHRADLQILLGDVSRALSMLKQGVEQGFKTPQILIKIAQYSLSHDRGEAFRWAQSAVECFPDDPQVRASAMHIGFVSGHGDWASMQLGILNQEFPDNDLYQQADLPMMLKWIQGRQMQSAANWRRFVEGNLPFHLWVDSEHIGLGAEFYWRWLFNKNCSADKHALLPISFGGRPASPKLDEWTGRSLVMDYTACLTAYLLKLFPFLETALDEIFITPSLLAIIEAEILWLSQTQTDRIEDAEELLARLESDSVTVLSAPEMAPDNFSGLLPADRLKWILAERHGLRIVEDRFATEMFNEGEIPPALEALRIDEAAVINALRATGELVIGDDNVHQIARHSTDIQRACPLAHETALLVDRPFLERLLGANGLSSAMHHFRLFCLDDLPERLRSEIEGHRYRQKVKDWLRMLLAELKGLRDKGKLRTLSVRQPVVESHGEQRLTHELRELLSGSEKLGHPVWIDDRMLSSYSKIGNRTSIIGVHDVLGMLHSKKRITDGKFSECHRKLIRHGAKFRLPAPDYLIYELGKTRFDKSTGKIVENLPLSRIRQAVAFALAPEGLLGETPLRQGIVPEKAQFKTQLHFLADAVMATIRSIGGVDYQHRAAMADWLHDSFFPHRGRIITEKTFKDDPLKGLAFEHSRQISLCWRLGGNPGSVRNYYSWLFNRLMPAWRNHPKLPTIIILHFAELVAKQLEVLSKLEHSEGLIARFARPLKHLPTEMLKDLLTHPALEPSLKHHFALGTHIGVLDLFVPQEVWVELTNKCIEEAPGKSTVGVVTGREFEVEFAPGGGVNDCIIVSGEAVNGLRSQERIRAPYARLGHPNPQVRREWLDDLVRGKLLNQEAASQWRDALDAEDHAVAVDAVYHACERSASFFFANASAVLSITAPSEHDWQDILPKNYEILETAASAGADTNGRFLNKEDGATMRDCIARLAALPFGAPFDLASIVIRDLKVGGISPGYLSDVARNLAATSFNPIVLQNLLDLFLRVPDLCDHDEPQRIVEILLAVEPDPAFSTAFDLYINLLHLIWSHFQLTPEFQKKSYEQWIIWAYIYADRMLQSLISRQSAAPNFLQPAVETTGKIGTELDRRISLFAATADRESDVTLPSAASRWRTVICGTLGVLGRDATTLSSIQAAIISSLESLFGSLLDSLRQRGEATAFGFEFLELSDYAQGPKNSNISNRGWATALELHARLTNQEKPMKPQPETFWYDSFDEPNVETLSAYLSVLARYPISADLQDGAAAIVCRIVDEYKFTGETRQLFRAAASLLGRLKSEADVKMREHMFEKVFSTVTENPSLWLEVCELAMQIDRFEEPNEKITRFIHVLGTLASLLPVETSEYCELLVWVRRFEDQLPPWSWPQLWAVPDKGVIPT